MVATSELLRPTTHPHPEVTTAGRVGRIAVIVAIALVPVAVPGLLGGNQAQGFCMLNNILR